MDSAVANNRLFSVCTAVNIITDETSLKRLAAMFTYSLVSQYSISLLLSSRLTEAKMAMDY